MKYSLTLESYRESFSVPNSIVHQHLKLAGALQLKVLLWICGNKGLCDDVGQIANDLGANPSDVQDALQYWICNDVIYELGMSSKTDELTATPVIEPQQPNIPSKAPVVALQMPKPTRQEVARRSAESEEVSWLMCEAQQRFNRTLSTSETSTLLWLMDTHGISPAIILMVIEYAVTVKKCNIKFIQTTAIDWANNEIDTVVKAEQHLTKLEQFQNDWYKVCRVFGVDKRKPSAKEEIYVERWLHSWCFSNAMLKCAYDFCVNNTGKLSFAYIDKVLNNWHAAGYKTPEDIQEKHTPKKTVGKSLLRKASQSKSSSYDINELEELI